MPKAWRRLSASRPAGARPTAWRNGCATTAGYCSKRIAPPPRRSVKNALSLLRPNGWSITFTSHEEQIREIRDDLPRGFYRQLPKLAEGPLEGYPRVFGIAWAFVAHTDSRFDPQMLCRFVQAYQRVQPLTIGELWAVAITLRIVLVENLRRAAERIVNESGGAPGKPTRWPTGCWESAGARPRPRAAVLRRFDEKPLAHGLRGAVGSALARSGSEGDTGAALAGPTSGWPGNDRRRGRPRGASDAGRDERDGAQRDHQHAPDVRGRLGGIFRERESGRCGAARRQRLRRDGFPDPGSLRHAIEELARGSGTPRSRLPDARSRPPSAQPPRPRAATARTARREQDPGYYLISKGRHALEKELGFRAPISDWMVRANAAAGILGYLGTIAIVGAFILALPLIGVAESGVSGWILFILAILAVIPASDAAVALVNRAVTIPFGPNNSAGLELRDGVPSSLRTMVVVPTLLTTPAELEEQVERLEVHYLASPDGDFRFALLSDWTDSATENAPATTSFSARPPRGIARLNQRHGPAPDGERFFLLHRRRIWNEGQGKWMGWERKRGKLHELNRLLRGATDTTFMADRRPLTCRACRRPLRDHPRCRYAAAARSGQAAGRQDGASAQRPRLDADSGRVVEGYAVLQPRVTPVVADRSRGIDFPARLLQPERHRPVRVRGLRRLPGSIRRRFVQRQGNLRRRRLRGRARGAAPRERHF